MTATGDTVEVLLAEHQDVRELFTEVEEATGEEREERFRYLVSRLAGHEAAEEAIVHRVLRNDVPSGRELADAILEEESSAEPLLAEMTDMDVSSSEFSAALHRLEEEVLAHAEHEEREEFPRLREHLDPDRRREMGEQFPKVRDAGPTRPHPHTPQTPGVRAAAGPVVGAFDQARDAVKNALRD